MRTEKSCGAVVFRTIEDKTEILLIRHVNGGHWAFPKGHVEKGETEEQTALREILEETGLAVVLDNRYRQVVSYSPKKDVIKDVVYFVAYAAADSETVRQESEISRIRWVDASDAVGYVSFDNDKKVMMGAIEHYMNNYTKK
ncbi:MAG: NUDIX domain-containing protein [Oscillospiraceae bacterium]|nr:NUDIX domain-containing protein [Oscillospiraceae bacterium]